MRRYFAVLALALLLQGCPVGTSGVVRPADPGASTFASAGTSDAKKEDHSLTEETADIPPPPFTPPPAAAPEPPAEETAMRRLTFNDTASHSVTRGLDTPLPAPTFDLTTTGLSALTGDFYFFSELERTYTPLPQNRMQTDIAGYIYVAHLDEASSCCTGRPVLVKDSVANVCRIVHVGINGYLEASLPAPQRKVPSLGLYFAPEGVDMADGIVDCDEAFEPFSHHKLFVFISWNVCKATLPDAGSFVFFANDTPWKADYCALPRVLDDSDLQFNIPWRSGVLKKVLIK